MPGRSNAHVSSLQLSFEGFVENGRQERVEFMGSLGLKLLKRIHFAP